MNMNMQVFGDGHPWTRPAILGAVLALLAAAPARAQLNGENLLGDMGVKSGTQPAPGVYVSGIYYRYFTDTIKNRRGETVTMDPSGEASQTIQAAVPLVTWVSKRKVLGGHYGMMAVLPVAGGSLEAPGFGLSEQTGVGLGDAYVMPAQIGWHSERADALVGLGIFAPTGRYQAGADDNLGKGMWSYEVSAGGTVYVDGQRSVSLSTTAFWETHGRKQGQVRLEDVTATDVRVGQLLTLEGGVGKSFMHGALSVGAAYYAQWKVTRDQMTLSGASGGVDVAVPGKHRVWGVGPEVTIPIATRTKLISLINVRYLWEQGSQLKTQGQTLLITNTIPIGGIRIPAR
jgi:hypothetical protein